MTRCRLTIDSRVPVCSLNDYLEQDKGLSHVFATMLVLLYGLGGLPGTLLGGYIGQRLYNSQRGLISVFRCESHPCVLNASCPDRQDWCGSKCTGMQVGVSMTLSWNDGDLFRIYCALLWGQ